MAQESSDVFLAPLTPETLGRGGDTRASMMSHEALVERNRQLEIENRLLRQQLRLAEQELSHFKDPKAKSGADAKNTRSAGAITEFREQEAESKRNRDALFDAFKRKLSALRRRVDGGEGEWKISPGALRMSEDVPGSDTDEAESAYDTAEEDEQLDTLEETRESTGESEPSSQ